MVGPAADREIVARMAAAQHNRGPDGGGIFAGEGVALGHRRLKILDLTDAGYQPMTTADGRYTIVYNGEVYNFRELRRDLERLGQVFRSGTDTEVVLGAYARWGGECLEHLAGMFGLAIWDREERILFCARDRLGIKPFYYAFAAGHFLFASDIRGLLAAGLKRAVNPQVLYDFLARDFYEHTDETFFEGIYKLPPGHSMRVKEGKAESPRSYWDLGEAAARIEVSKEGVEREERLIDLTREVVRAHLVSDVPIGIALSGGLDSALLLALLDQSHPDPRRVEAFSFTCREEAYSERPYVEAMARHTERVAHFIEITPDKFKTEAERFCNLQQEPFAGAPIAAYSLCFEEARRQGFIVMMDGSGVDEGLAGYTRFRPAYWADLFVAGNWNGLKMELLASGMGAPDDRKRALSQMQAAMSPEGDVGLGQDLTASVRPECLEPDFASRAARPVPRFAQPFPDSLRNLMYRELRYTKLPRALRFRDRLSMAVGTELRPPFLDHRLLSYEFALPAEDRISGGVSKVILRRAAGRLLPEAVRMASKRSVQTPQREWFRSELKEWVRERVDTPSFWERGWVNRKAGLGAMEGFFRGEGDNSFFLWQWINLEMWAQEYLDS